MTVIPAINETDFPSVESKMRQAEKFGAAWVHLDVADGKFTPNLLWNNPQELKANSSKLKANAEVHLMVENSDSAIDDWIDAGVKRIIVHIEAINLSRFNLANAKCHASGVEFFLACNPETSIEELLKYKNNVDGFLVLAVTPGRAGQKFDNNQLKKIRTLREKFSNAKIEVDGGVNLENALAIKNAGADILVSASYIWNSGDSKKAYKNLQSI